MKGLRPSSKGCWENSHRPLRCSTPISQMRPSCSVTHSVSFSKRESTCLSDWLIWTVIHRSRVHKEQNEKLKTVRFHLQSFLWPPSSSAQTSRSTQWRRYRTASPSSRWTESPIASRASTASTTFAVSDTTDPSTKDPKTETTSSRWVQTLFLWFGCSFYWC